jgi:hypothetical protein
MQVFPLDNRLGSALPISIRNFILLISGKIKIQKELKNGSAICKFCKPILILVFLSHSLYCMNVNRTVMIHFFYLSKPNHARNIWFCMLTCRPTGCIFVTFQFCVNVHRTVMIQFVYLSKPNHARNIWFGMLTCRPAGIYFFHIHCSA